MNIEDRFLEKARKKGELHLFLAGYPQYSISSDTADLPTDFGAVTTAIQKIIKVDTELQVELVKAIRLLASDEQFGWMAVFYLGSLRLIHKYQGVNLLEDDLVADVANELRKNKETFQAIMKWEGSNYPDGIWGVVRSANKKLHVKDNITVLPEEL